MPHDLGGLFYGVYPALVVDLADPQNIGRVKLKLPWLDGPQVWARLATLTTGPGFGSWFPPREGSEVLVAFEAGDVSRPYVIGMLWNGRDQPPAVPGKQDNDTQVLTTSRGTHLVFDENADGSSLRLETRRGQRVVLSDSPEGVTVQNADGTKVTLKDSNVEVEASGTVRVAATQINLAAATITLDSAMVNMSGMVACTTLKTDTVIAATYTPGAGNIW
jgi:uncharacterized protein involved in type VI secretion and phage assembly